MCYFAKKPCVSAGLTELRFYSMPTTYFNRLATALSVTDTIKLTKAPTAANKAVLATFEAWVLHRMQSIVPPMVPALAPLS